MSLYQVATGFNVALVDLNTLSPQPSSIGIQVTRRTFGSDGTPFEEGKYVELLWNVLNSPTEYQAILTAFGLSDTTLVSAVTVYVRNSIFDWVRLNGYAIRPDPGKEVRWANFFPRDVTILVRELTAVV